MENSKSSIIHELTFAKFFVQRSGFFNSSKRLLIIYDEGLALSTLKTPTIPDETFLFDNIASIDVSLRNDRDFSIKTKKNTSVTLSCTARAHCLCELYQAWDTSFLKRSSCSSPTFPMSSPKQSMGFSIYQALRLVSLDSKILLDVDIMLYRGHLDIVHKYIGAAEPVKKDCEECIVTGDTEDKEGVVKSIVSILYSRIRAIYKNSKGIVIETCESRMVYELVIPNSDSIADIAIKLQHNYKAFMNSTLEIHNREHKHQGSTPSSQSWDYPEYIRTSMSGFPGTPQSLNRINQRGSACNSLKDISSKDSESFNQSKNPLFIDLTKVVSPKCFQISHYTDARDSPDHTKGSQVASSLTDLRAYHTKGSRSKSSHHAYSPFDNNPVSTPESRENQLFRVTRLAQPQQPQSISNLESPMVREANTPQNSNTYRHYSNGKGQIPAQSSDDYPRHGHNTWSPSNRQNTQMTETLLLPKLFFYYYKAHKMLETGEIFPVMLGLTDDYLAEIDMKGWSILQRYRITAIEYVTQLALYPRLQLLFKDMTSVTYILPIKKQQELAVNLQTLAREKQNSSGNILYIQKEFVHSKMPDYRFKIYGWNEGEPDLEYLNSLVKSLCNENNETRFIQLLQEFNLNGNLKSLTDFDAKPLQVLIKALKEKIEIIKTNKFYALWKLAQCKPLDHDEALSQNPMAGAKKESAKRNYQKVSICTSYKTIQAKYVEEASEAENGLTICKVLSTLFKTEEILKTLTIFLTSPVYFREFSHRKAEPKVYQDLFLDIIYLLNSFYPVHSYLAGSFLRAFCNYPDTLDKRAERLNRRFLLQSKINIMHWISQNLLTKVLVPQNTLDPEIYHSVTSCLSLLKTLICERKESMDPEDRAAVLSYISKPFVIAAFNLLLRVPLISLIYTPTMLISYFLQNCDRPEQLRTMQNRCLENSPMVLFHLIQVLSCASRSQRKLSLTILYLILKDNMEACELIKRIFPDYMFTKVEEAPEELIQWTITHWILFFIQIQNDFITPTDHWDGKCRSELVSKLMLANQDMLQSLARCPENRIEEVWASQNGNEGSFLLNLRWNYEEFEIKYNTLEVKTRVGIYFLSALLEEKEFPRLVIDIANPIRFWNELNIRFMNTGDQSDMIKILKTMTLLYIRYYKDIGEFRSISYFLKCLVDPFYYDARYLILQFLYTSLSLKDEEISLKNKQSFIYAKGFSTLADALSDLYFLEDHNECLEILETPLINAPDPMTFNYTTLNLPKQGSKESYKASNMIFIIINIFKLVLQAQQPMERSLEAVQRILYPLSPAKQQAIEPSTLRCLVNVLILTDDDLIIEILELLTDYIIDQFSLNFLVHESPLIDFVLYNMSSKTIAQRASLLVRLYNLISQPFSQKDDPIRKYLDSYFNIFVTEMAQKASELFPLIRYLPKRLLWLLFNEEVQEFTKVFFSASHESPDLIWKASMRQNLQNALNTHIQPYKQELVDYTNSSVTPSRHKIPLYHQKIVEDLYSNLQDEVRNGPIFLRIWNRKAFRTFSLNQSEVSRFIQGLYSLLHTHKFVLTTGPESQKSSPRIKHLEDLSADENIALKRNLSCHTLENTNQPFDDMLVVLEAHSKAIKLYKIQNYQCFEQVLEILEHFSDHLVEGVSRSHSEGPSPYEMTHCILVICRIICHCVSVENSENMELFLNAGGLQILLGTMQSVIKHMNITRYGETFNQYLDLRLLHPDIKIITQIIRVIKIILTERPRELETLTNEYKQQMFLGLQEAAKLSIIVFETLESRATKESKAPDTKKNSVSEHPDEGIHFGPLFRIPSLAAYESTSAGALEMMMLERTESQPELYLDKVFELTQDLEYVLLYFSAKVVFIPVLIRAGVGWRCLEYITYYGEPIGLNTMKVFKNIENACLVLRNIMIYCNEANEFRSKKPVAADKDETKPGSTITNEKPSQVEIDLSQVGDAGLRVMTRFCIAVTNLIGKYMIESLVEDCVAPPAMIQPKDLEGAEKFLKVFASSFYDPSTLWNEDIRAELKNLMASQLLAVNNSKGKSVFNQVEGFQYSVHKKYLLINKIFVSLYNKSPQWKIKDPGPFILCTLEKAASLWQDLKDFVAAAAKEITFENNDISSTLFNLNEAIAAISNVITHHGSEEVLLVESRITILASLLNDKRTKKIEDPYVVNLKVTALSIFTRLAKTTEGAIKLVENVNFIKNATAILKSNTKEGSFLADKVLKAISNIVSHGSLNQILVNFGVWLMLLKFFLKTEIHPRTYRKEALRLFLDIVKSSNSNNLLYRTLEILYPPKIRKMLLLENDMDRILDHLDNGYDSPKIIWTKLMRYELLFVLHKEGETVQNRWNRYNGQEIKYLQTILIWEGPEKMRPPVFPEIQENLCINGIYLRNFNRNPSFDEEDNSLGFLEKIVISTEEIYDEFIEKTIMYENSSKSPIQAMSLEQQKKLDRLSCAMVSLLTALLLTLDKVLNCPFKKEELNCEKTKELLTKASQENMTDYMKDFPGQPETKSTAVSERVFLFILKCINLFDHSKVHLHILSTELQLLYLLSNDNRGLAYLKEYEIILFLTNLLSKISNASDSTPSPFTHVEEKLICYFLLKLVLQDEELIPEAFHECKEHLNKILSGPKEYLRDIVLHIIAVMIRSLQKEDPQFLESDKSENMALAEIDESDSEEMIASLWKPLNQGFQPYQVKNILSVLRKRQKDLKIDFPAISDYSFVSLPHMGGDNLKHEQEIKQHVSKIIEENSNSKDCMSIN